MIRIIFIGAVEFSEKVLKKLLELNANIVGVITKEESNFNSDFVSLKDICETNNLKYKLVKTVNGQDTENWIKSKKPDIIFCFGWSQLINKTILQIPRFGTVGFHPAELPMNKGRHPIIWALFLGLKQTASTFFFMDENADTGNIISQKVISIEFEDDARLLYDKILDTALNQIEEFYYKLLNNDIKSIPQKNEKTNFWRKRNYLDGRIDWRMNSIAIYNLVRALTKPYVGAHTLYSNKEIIIWKTKPINYDTEVENLEPGKVLFIDPIKNYIDVKTYDSVIRILEHEFELLPSIGDYLI